jgi:prefoldin subunit 5
LCTQNLRLNQLQTQVEGVEGTISQLDALAKRLSDLEQAMSNLEQQVPPMFHSAACEEW